MHLSMPQRWDSGGHAYYSKELYIYPLTYYLIRRYSSCLKYGKLEEKQSTITIYIILLQNTRCWRNPTVFLCNNSYIGIMADRLRKPLHTSIGCSHVSRSRHPLQVERVPSIYGEPIKNTKGNNISNKTRWMLITSQRVDKETSTAIMRTPHFITKCPSVSIAH